MRIRPILPCTYRPYWIPQPVQQRLDLASRGIVPLADTVEISDEGRRLAAGISTKMTVTVTPVVLSGPEVQVTVHVRLVAPGGLQIAPE